MRRQAALENGLPALEGGVDEDACALLDLLELDILAKENGARMLLGRRPLRFAENLAHVRQVTAIRFLAIISGRQDRREVLDEE